MHFIVSWEIKGQGLAKSAIASRLRECLSGYSWVRPLRNFYIVRARSELDRLILIDRFKEVATTHKKKVSFVASPLMKGGKYRGWLPGKYWGMIDKRVHDVEQRQQ